MDWKRVWVRRGLYLVVLFLFFSFSKTLFQTYQASKRVETLENEVKALREEKQSLEGEHDHRESESYIEAVAREKLNLIKPGDTVVVVKEGENDSESGSVGSNSQEQPTDLSIPEQWKQVILGV